MSGANTRHKFTVTPTSSPKPLMSFAFYVSPHAHGALIRWVDTVYVAVSGEVIDSIAMVAGVAEKLLLEGGRTKGCLNRTAFRRWIP